MSSASEKDKDDRIAQLDQLLCNQFKRSVSVENALNRAWKAGRSIPPDEARKLALKLGVPDKR